MKRARGAEAFLQNDKNGVELFTMFADNVVAKTLHHIISTKSERAVNKKDSLLNAIQACA